jgi:PIN domain nuclease of toxin-antitoxin system
VWDDIQLGINARTLIVDSSNQKRMSAATYGEIAIKVSIGKLDLGETYRGFMHRELNRNNFEMLLVSVDHAAVVSSLPFHHRDPFDRLLIAQAMVEQRPIVSGDPAFDAHSIARLW